MLLIDMPAVVVGRKKTSGYQLTKREMSCLLHAAKGMSSRESAKVLNIKQSTVEMHRKKIKQKLFCNTIAQAVFEGMCQGYVHSEK